MGSLHFLKNQLYCLQRSLIINPDSPPCVALYLVYSASSSCIVWQKQGSVRSGKKSNYSAVFFKCPLFGLHGTWPIQVFGGYSCYMAIC